MRGVIFILLVLAIVTLKVNAISVASDYLTNDTLELISGTSKIYSIRLQNPSDYEVGIRLDYDATFMKAIDYKEIYILPPQTTGYRIEFNVTAPKKAGLHRVGYTVAEVEPIGGGGLPIRLKINRNFNLRVIEDPNKFKIDYDYVVYAVIVLAFLFYVFWQRHNTKRKKHKSRRFL